MRKLHKSGRLVIGALLTAVVAGEVSADLVPVKSKFEVSLYGYVKLDASYDTHRTHNGNLMFFVLPEGEAGKQDEFNMTARETRLGLNISLPEVDGIRVTGRTEIDFYSGASENSPNPRLRLAYADVSSGNWSLRAGQDWDTFITVLPKILNISTLADAGALGLRRPQLRVTHVLPLDEKARLITQVAAARTIGQDLDGGGQDDGAASGYPTLQANILLEMPWIAGRLLKIGVSGHAGTETVAAYAAGEDDRIVPETDYDTWSLIGSVGIPLSTKMTLQGTVWTGENLDTYFGGIGQGVNKALGRGIGASGGWAQWMLNITPKLNVNVGYGLDRPDKDDLNAGDRSNNEIMFSSLYYHVARSVTFALEYSHMTTDYKTGENASNDRVQGAMIFPF